MRNFNPNNKFGGGGRDFNSDRNDRPMHRTVCARCGKECEVPFKPTGARPVYCNDCFRDSKGDESRNSEPRYSENRYSSPAPRFQDRPRYEERSFDRAPKNPETFQYKQSFEALNAKLDKIIKLLTPVAQAQVAPAAAAPKKEEKAAKVEKTEEVKTEAPKKKKKTVKKEKV